MKFMINTFGGMVPAVDDRLLANNAAAYAKNTWLRDGKLRGYRPSTLLRALSLGGATKVFRIPNNFALGPAASFASSTWMEFADFDTDVLRTPIVNDQYSRYYWTSPSSGPMYNTLANIQTGTAGFTLGVPAPTSPVTLTTSGGSSTTNSTRAYLVTWVTAYGEEGPPSPPSTVTTGKIDASWNLTLTPPGGAVTTGRNITKTRIYRTVTSDQGIASYFLVAEVARTAIAYQDVLSDTTVSLNNQLESTNWAPPPSTLKGFVQMPNGIIAAWTGADIYFCEPYHPHAWPAQYSVTVDSPVVGMGVFGQALVICTSGHPTLMSGVHPSQMSQSTYATAEPCLSRSSIISTPDGVVFASQNGLMMANAGGVQNLTTSIITEEQWINDVNPYVLRAARHRAAYIAARSDASNGFVMDGGLQSFSWLNSTGTDITYLNDTWSGETFSIHGGNVYWFDPPDRSSESSYLWRSKIFRLPYPDNLGAAKVIFTVPAGAPSLGSLNTAQPQTLASTQYLLFRVYADGTLVHTREIQTSGQIFKLPSGFKAAEWQFELEGRVEVTTVEVASSARELRAV